MKKKGGSLLVGKGTVITLGERSRMIPRGAVLIRDGVIERVGRWDVLSRAARGVPRLDAGGGLIMPGFINAHTHLYSSLARGLAPKSPPPRNFVEILERMWWPLDRALKERDLMLSALVGAMECIRSGTTLIIDHHESQGFQAGSLDVLYEALRRAGLRGCLCLGVSDRYGKGGEGLAENIRFIEGLRRRRADGGGLVTGMVGLHALFTVNQRTLRSAVEAAGSLGVGLHVHVAEDLADQKYNLRRYGRRVVRRLGEAGGLGPRTIAVHCVHVDRREIRQLAKTGTCVVHNPESNMNNAVGVAPIADMLEAGVLVGLGSDGMTADMRVEARTASLLHKLAAGDPRVFFMESYRLLLENNARIATRMFDHAVGVLEAGAYGDVVVVDYDPPTPMTPDNFAGHFLFGVYGARVRHTVVAGRVLMRDGQLLTLDEARIKADARRSARALWKRF